MSRSKKEKIRPRPSDKLSEGELKRQWGAYLDSIMGKPNSTPRRLILVTPRQLEMLAEKIPQDWMKLQVSPKVGVYLEALKRCLPKLKLMSRLVLKKYYGIGGDGSRTPKTQQEIAKELGLSSQQMASKHLIRAKARLKSMIRKELKLIVREQIRKSKRATK